ncbi:hypothetical protein AB0M02_36130 [Actinoplanes sp. NPDC051861]|uniref:hypothetical protein n=1 Tax=Actinoplanes sp. NPDC051861 TaxID=3155170 RepID=UPI003418FE7C
MTEPHVRLDRPRRLGPLLHRLRWNPHVLGALAYPMAAHPADDSWGVPPTGSGHHLRWSVDPRRGAPAAGFFVYRRGHERFGAKPTHEISFLRSDEERHATALGIDVGEPAPLRLRHPAGFRLVPRSGLELPPSAAPFEFTLPTTGRSIQISLVDVPAGAEVRATHAGHLVHFARTTRAEADWLVTCFDQADQIHISAPGARIFGIAWIRVPGDLAGWVPLARFPPLGTAPLDRAGIAHRLGEVDLTDADRDLYLDQILGNLDATAAPVSWPADDGGSGLDIEAGLLLATLTLQPRLASAFGRYLVDVQPAEGPSDYLVVAGWMDMPFDAAPPGSLPYVPGGPALDELIENLRGRGGLLYFAPCYAVTARRAWTPRPARLDAFEVVTAETRRQMDAGGQAVLEMPLRTEWSLRRAGRPLLAAQQTPLALVTFTGPGADPAPRVVTASATTDGHALVELVAPLLSALPGSMRISLTALDLFGHLTGPADTRTLPLEADLYPAAPPPVGVLLQVVPPSPDLRVTWQWGGRLRLFHPDVRGFAAEWIEDSDLPAGVPTQEALRDETIGWNALPRVASTPPHAAHIDALESSLAGRTTTAVLLREDGTLLGGVRTGLGVAPGAAGRLATWSLRLGSGTFGVRRHTVGDDVWLYLDLAGDAGGTPFAGFTEGQEQPLDMPWTLTPPADTAGAIVRVSGAAADLGALVPGSLLTQGALVFGVLAHAAGPPALALLDLSTPAQEPGAPVPPRPLPAVGDVEFDAPATSLFAGVGITAPTAAHARRRVWVRVRTVDALDRAGTAGSPAEGAWAKAFPPVPADGPAVVRRSPPDAFGHCRLLVRFGFTLADHGAVLYRASDAQLGVMLARAQRAVAEQPGTAFAALPAGFVWPAGGPQRPEDVTDPLTDFAGDPDMMRVFCNELRIDEGASTGPRPVFLDAFERRGRMTGPGLIATADDAPLELDDIVERAGNRYLYLVRLIDGADQEGGVSGVSLPGQGWDIAAPATPVLLPVFVTGDELIIRWRPLPDPRVTRYRVTLSPRWDAAPPAAVVERPPGEFPSPVRIEGDRVSLPGFVVTPVPSDLTSVTTVADGVERVSEGFVVAATQQFVWWCAAGNGALVVATGAADVRDRVPAEHSAGVEDGAVVDPGLLALGRGVLDGEPLGIPAGVFDRLLARELDGTFVDRTAAGAWHDDDFLSVPPALEEAAGVVLETTSPTGTRHTVGRCPGAPAEAVVAVTGGVIGLGSVASRLAAGDRPSGVFRADEVTRADATGAPDPRTSGATNLIDAAVWYRSGFVRRVRNGVPMVLRWRGLADGRERFLTTAPGGRPLRMLDGSLVVAPWSASGEVLDGVYERATVGITGTTVSIPFGARNLAADVLADPATGRIVTLLADGVPVRVRRRDGSEIGARFAPLTWRERRLAAGGLFGDGVLHPDALHAFEPDATGQLVPRVDRDRLGSAVLAADGTALVAVGLPAEGSRVAIEYGGDGVARTVDPGRLELSVSLTAADVGRAWDIEVEALCDFPDPVGAVSSLPAITQVTVRPPRLDLAVTSARWTAANTLEIRYAGPASLHYRVEAVSVATGRRYVLADPAAGGVVTTAVALDGTPVPLAEALSVELTAWYENAADQPYLAEPVPVDPALPDMIS